jgi:hypothetical protein
LPPRVAINDRDRTILTALATARFLTAVALEWICFPDRRAAWEADMQARMAGERRPFYKPGRVVHRRLRLLEEAGFIYRIPRPISRTGRGGGRDPDIFMLTERGGDQLCEDGVLDDASMATFRVRPRSSFTTDHSAEIGQVYAALRTKIESMDGVTMEEWHGDHITAKSHDQVTVTRRGAAGLERVQLPVVPDGTFVLVHPKGRVRVFVEVDRGTRRAETWRDKIIAYHAYRSSAALKARYAAESFVLLTVVPTRTQQRKLINATASVLGEASNRYLFCLRESVHPLRIGGEWVKISGIARSRMPSGLNGSPVEKVNAEVIPHVFLQ